MRVCRSFLLGDWTIQARGRNWLARGFAAFELSKMKRNFNYIDIELLSIERFYFWRKATRINGYVENLEIFNIKK